MDLQAEGHGELLRIICEEFTKSGAIMRIARMVERILKSTLANICKWDPGYKHGIIEEYNRGNVDENTDDTPLAVLRKLVLNLTCLLEEIDNTYDFLRCLFHPKNKTASNESDGDIIFEQAPPNVSRWEVAEDKISQARDWFKIVGDAFNLHRIDETDIQN